MADSVSADREGISKAGIQDDAILPLLHRLKRPTLFTQDEDFFKRRLCHSAYCLVWLNVRNFKVASYIRHFLRHPDFRIHSQRQGKVVRVHSDGLEYWCRGGPNAARLVWSESI